MKRFILILSLILILSQNSIADDSGDNGGGECTGRMINPITDLCWDCIFPISIGAIEIPTSSHSRPDTENFLLYFLFCDCLQQTTFKQSPFLQFPSC